MKERISNIQFIVNRCKELVECIESGKDFSDELDNIKSLIKTFDGSDYK